MGPAMRVALEAPGIVNSIDQSKSVPKAFSGAVYNFGNNKISIRSSSLLRSSEVTLTNHEIKYIMKVIRSLENRGTLLKATTKNINNEEKGFLNFSRPLKTFGLPLTKNVHTPWAKSELARVNDSSFSNRCNYLK